MKLKTCLCLYKNNWKDSNQNEGGGIKIIHNLVSYDFTELWKQNQLF